mmetsp:Transcript_5424/g.9131  ORF Transcript_5424/g.9131 Transcript_5424/m.9131 type:complete len:232 (-) Transcript_5424:1076-1771(-)
MLQRGLNQEKMAYVAKLSGINQVVHFPLNDNSEELFIEQLFEGCRILDDLLNKKRQKVLVHCNSGISRAPAIVICYLCLFLRHENWQEPKRVERYLKDLYVLSTPNMGAVTKMLEKNKEFQQQEALRQNRDKDENERSEKLRKAQEEAEKLRLQRLAEHEAEKLRLQRLQFEENERLRKLREAEQEAERLRLEKEAEMERLRLERLAEEERLRIQKLREEEDRRRKEEEER